MSASARLDRYLASFSQRLKKLAILQGTAAAAIVVLVMAVIGAWFATESGYAASTVITFRILIVLALAAVIIRFIAWPLQRIRRNVSQQVEARTPGFEGRIRTYVDMKQADHPLRDLLAEDTLKLSTRHPVQEQVESREFAAAGLVAAAALGILFYLLLAGPGMLNYSLRNLFAGWAVDDLLPPQSIVVTPGDQSVRRGASLRIASTMQGFDPDEALIHVRYEGEDWQEVPMEPGTEGFEFTFLSLQQPVQYYVSARGLRTEDYDINVVDLPSIESLALTYHYPDWTQRESETFENQGDIRTLPDTRVEMNVTLSAPLPEGGQLVLNQEARDLQANGTLATTDFTVTEDGEYYLSAWVGDQQVRLSNDYFIRLSEDGSPSIEFTRPGRDWNASNIEEVLVGLRASDDYGLEAVELTYSINGGDWQSIDMAAADNAEQTRELEAQHLFMLEDMRTPVIQTLDSSQVGGFNIALEDPFAQQDEPRNEEDRNEPAAEGEAEPAPPEMEALQPGDLISYYALARDRNQTARTDMFFIQVQQFNRRYEQSQLSGGGGGGGGGQQDEISQRQRQIIVSTWNLIREREEAEDDGPVQVNSSLLSDLQTTLAEQAQTLVQRSRARQLTAEDEQIARFIQSMEQAVQAMHPTAELLADVELDKAIGPAQTALQHLLRAEAVFNEISITQQQGGGGAGGSASSDLAEMFELEMDMEKNQYETGNRASPQAQQQEAEDIMKELDKLARRQEQLADNLRNQQQLTEAQRYQQDMLRREAEQLQERLDQLERDRQAQQQANNQQQGQQQANNQQGGQQQDGQQQGGQQQGGQQQGGESQEQAGEGQQVAQSELQRRLESAIRAMNESAEAMNGNTSREELQRAADEARAQLAGARDQVAQQQSANMQEAFSSMAEQSEQMLREQERMAQQLRDAMEKAVADRESGEDPNSRGMELEEEWALAREKQEMAGELQRLQQQMLSTMQRFGEEVPEASNELEQANNRLIQSELEQAISDAALYIDSGYGLYIAGNESNVTNAMRELAERLARAQEAAAAGGGDNQLEQARRQAQALRTALQENLNRQGGQQQPAGGAAQDNTQPGETNAAQEGQQQAGNGQQAGGGGGAFGGRGAGGWWTEGEDLRNGPVQVPENFYDNLNELTQAARQAAPDMNLGGEELAQMYELIRELELARSNRNESIIAREYNEMLSLVEQLEVSLQLESDDRNVASVRTAVQEEIPEEYRDAVAEYYRRLSRDD